jgi:hypothetical protein
MNLATIVPPAAPRKRARRPASSTLSRRPANRQRSAPLVGRVRANAVRAAVKSWNSVGVSGNPDGLACAAIAHALNGLARILDTWDTPEGEALVAAAFLLGNIPARLQRERKAARRRKALAAGPVVKLDAYRLAVAAGGR